MKKNKIVVMGGLCIVLFIVLVFQKIGNFEVLIKGINQDGIIPEQVGNVISQLIKKGIITSTNGSLDWQEEQISLDVPQSGVILPYFRNRNKPQDYVASTEFEWNTDNNDILGCGFIFDRVSRNDYLIADINNRGGVSVTKYQNGNWLNLISDQLEPNEIFQINQLTLVLQGYQLLLNVNGHEFFATINNRSIGINGLAAESGSGDKNRCSFQNSWLWNIDSPDYILPKVVNTNSDLTGLNGTITLQNQLNSPIGNITVMERKADKPVADVQIEYAYINNSLIVVAMPANHNLLPAIQIFPNATVSIFPSESLNNPYSKFLENINPFSMIPVHAAPNNQTIVENIDILIKLWDGNDAVNNLFDYLPYVNQQLPNFESYGFMYTDWSGTKEQFLYEFLSAKLISEVPIHYIGEKISFVPGLLAKLYMSGYEGGIQDYLESLPGGCRKIRKYVLPLPISPWVLVDKGPCEVVNIVPTPTNKIPPSGFGPLINPTLTPNFLYTPSSQSASTTSTPELAGLRPWFGQGCSTFYTGPGGLKAGGYAPSSLTLNQRQWLFEVFGNEGIASVGYGGQACSSQATLTHPAWFGQGCGTSYTGPGGLKAGGYAPSSLAMNQRQWLFEVFGNEGIASVGYGGQACPWQAAPTHPAWFGQGCGTSYTGPGGLKAGGYAPTSISQEQRQWLFEVFGNEGIASVGYGGQACPWQAAPTHPAWFGQGCGTSFTGPGGLKAGGYAPTSISQEQRQWLFEVFGNEGIASVGYGGQACPWQAAPTHPAWFGQGCGTSFTGPGGLKAGGYAPTSISQEQRQWLFEVFGNEGIASVGYGGQACPWQDQTVTHPPWFGQGCGTLYTGPGGLKAGGYAPTSLSQDQRQWLFEVFGNNGIASVGYGGQACP